MDEEPKGVPPELTSRWPSDPALQLLAEALCQIFTTQYSGTVGSKRRKQCAIALRHVTTFLEKNDFPPFVVGRFKDLMLDIRDLDSGKVADFLKPVSVRNRHIDASEVWRARAYVAIALDVLAEDSPIERAINADRQAFPGGSGLPSGREKMARAVQEWPRQRPHRAEAFR
jgi:hypothetical protein